MTDFIINTGESFEHLRSAPLVEAVIEIRANAVVPWDESAVRAELAKRLEGYEFKDAPHEFHVEGRLEPGKPPFQQIRDLGLKGVRVHSADKKHVAQFNKDGFVFSRMEPYTDWKQFKGEALKLWLLFCEMARPAEVGRIGLRFINRIRFTPDDQDFTSYIRPAPEAPAGIGLAIGNFLHQDLLEVPGHPYAVRVLKALQPRPEGGPETCSVILDIDVFTPRKPDLDEAMTLAMLEEMRWLKNKVFFGSITETALRQFQGEIK